MAQRYKPGHKHDVTGRSKKGERFYRLQHSILESEAWRSLRPCARSVYIALAQHYTPYKNGRIHLSVREAADLANVNKDTAARALKTLQERGLIACETPGGFSRKTRHAAEWRLTAHPVDGEQHGTREYRDWKPEENPRSEKRGQVVPIRGTVCPKRRDSG